MHCGAHFCLVMGLCEWLLHHWPLPGFFPLGQLDWKQLIVVLFFQQDLLDPARWRMLIQQFRYDNYRLHQLGNNSVFTITLQAGLSAIKTPYPLMQILLGVKKKPCGGLFLPYGCFSEIGSVTLQRFCSCIVQMEYKLVTKKLRGDYNK